MIYRIINEFLLALTFLTRFPVGKLYQFKTVPPLENTIYLYPVIGAILGCFYALIYTVLSFTTLPHLIIILITFGFMLISTGCFHEDGLADVADGFGGAFERTRKMEIMRDSRLGTYGSCALFMSLFLRIALLYYTVSPETAWSVFIASEMVSRMPISLMAAFFPYAQSEHNDSKGKLAKAATNASKIQFILSLAITALISLLLISWPTVIMLICVTLCLSFLWGKFCLYQIQGVTGDAYGASQQLNAIIVLLILCV